MKTTIRTYSELIQIPTFEERYHYLKLDGRVGEETFGVDRWINQQFYRGDPRWLSVRDKVIIRDNGCDLGCSDRMMKKGIVIHHMNPITVEDVAKASDYLLNPEYLICCSKRTHNAIHYGDETILLKDYKPREPNDTIPWRH